MKYRVDCLLCGVEGEYLFSKPYTTDSGRAVGFVGSQGEFLRCPECGLAWVANIPETYEELYSTGEVYAGAYASQGRYDHDLGVGKARVKRLREVCPDFGSPVLDVGCGNGAFVTMCHYAGISDAYGIDIDKTVVKAAKEYVGEQYIFAGAVHGPALNGQGPFRIITCFDAFEHFIHPISTLCSIAAQLAEGGWCIIEIPDYRIDMTSGELMDWKHTRPLEHLFYFDVLHMERMGRHAHFNLATVDRPIEGKATYYFKKGNLAVGFPEDSH